MFFAILLIISACSTPTIKIPHTRQARKQIGKMLDQWHRDVATYNYEAYFDKMTNDAVFVGTDASEVWQKKEFQDFAKPFFLKKQTWNFIPVSRHIYGAKENIAWFDEILDTWMGLCRGSGVVVKKGAKWKIQHYVLSIAIPNDITKQVSALKKTKDSLYLLQYQKN